MAADSANRQPQPQPLRGVSALLRQREPASLCGIPAVLGQIDPALIGKGYPLLIIQAIPSQISAPQGIVSQPSQAKPTKTLRAPQFIAGSVPGALAP